MKTCLVLEGGAMRGMFTAGALDVFYSAGIRFDGIIGVSAGAAFGVNYLSGQPGRVIRYNKRFNSDHHYMGLIPLLKTGNIVDTEYAYDKVPRQLDPFDGDTFDASGVPFWAVVTNVETGQAEYIRLEHALEQMDVIRASASMPFVSKPVKIDGKLYLDGGVADSIPFKAAEQLGDISRLPFSMKVLLENLLRNELLPREEDDLDKPKFSLLTLLKGKKDGGEDDE